MQTKTIARFNPIWGGSRLIGISKYQYLGHCFFDWGESSESPVYYIFQVSAIDSTGEETITRDFYLISRKDFYKYHNSPGASVYGSEKIGFSSCSVDGFTTLDHAIAKIKEERGRDDISEELHLEQDDQFTVYDPMPLAYKNQVTVLFQEADLVYALFMNGGTRITQARLRFRKNGLSRKCWRRRNSARSCPCTMMVRDWRPILCRSILHLSLLMPAVSRKVRRML